MGAEEAEEIDAAAGIEGEGSAGERRVDEIGEAAAIRERLLGQVVEAHGHVGKEAAFRRTAHENENVRVARVLGDGVGELRDGLFFAFEALQEVAVLIEEHTSDAEGIVFGAGALEHVFDFGNIEIFRGGADIDDAKHGGLRCKAEYTGAGGGRPVTSEQGGGE